MKFSKKLKLIINWLFILLVFLTPLVFSFQTSELFEFPKMMLVYAFSSVIVTLWLIRSVLEKRFIFKRTPLDIPILLFFLAQLASTIFSIHPYTSVWGYYSRFHGGLASTITYIGLYYALVANGNLKLFKKMMLASMASGVLIAVYGILEHFGHSVSCLLVTKGASFGVDCWVQDVKHRVFATLGQPNWLAALMDMLIFFGLYFVLKAKKFWQVALALVVTLSYFIALIYSGSRSGFLAAGVGLLVWLGLIAISLVRQRKNTKYTYYVIGYNTKYTYFLLAGILVSFGLVVATLGSPFNQNQNLTQIFKQSTQVVEKNVTKVKKEATTPTTPAKPLAGGTDSGVIRAIVWKGAVDVWRRYPILGSGPETFAYSYYLDRPLAHNAVSEWNFLYNKAHNEFLNFSANTGIVGLATYLILLFAFFIVAFLSWYKGKQPMLMITLAIAVLALSVSNFFGFSTVSVSLLMWLAFAAVSLVSIKNHQQTKKTLAQAQKTVATKAQEPVYRSKKARKRQEMLAKKKKEKLKTKGVDTTLQWWQYLLVTLLVLGCIFDLSWVWRSYTADKDYKLSDALIKAGKYQEGFAKLESAVAKKPKEALFQSRLAFNQAKLALVFARQKQEDQTNQVAETALVTSDNVIKLNDQLINFYKTRARTLTLLAATYETLAKVNPDKTNFYQDKSRTMMQLAVETLERARRLAPNEPSLSLDLAKVQNALNNPDAARALFEETLKLKPDYADALWTYSQFLIEQKDYQRAKEVLEQFIKEVDTENKEVNKQLAIVDALIASQSGKIKDKN